MKRDFTQPAGEPGACFSDSCGPSPDPLSIRIFRQIETLNAIDCLAVWFKPLLCRKTERGTER